MAFSFGWIIGVCIYMVGRTSMAFGANLQRYSMRIEQLKPPLERRPKKRQPLLLTGIALFVTSGMFLSIALIFAPQTLLSPCGVIIFVSNAVFASYLNEETFEWKVDGICNFFVMVGVVMCVVAAPKQEAGQDGAAIKTYTSDELVELYKSWTFVFFILLVAGLVVGLSITKWRILSRVNNDWSRLQEMASALTVINLAFGVIAGTLGGFNITITKSIFQVIGGEFVAGGVVGVLTSPLAYLLGGTVLFTFVYQLVAVTDGLEKCNTLVVIPCQAMTEELIATLGGLLYFQDYRQFDMKGAIIFTLGDCLAVASVIVLVRIRMKRAVHQALQTDEDVVGTDADWENTSDTEMDPESPTTDGKPLIPLTNHSAI